MKKKILEFGGVAAGILLIAFGIAAIALGFQGKSTVTSSLKEQQIQRYETQKQILDVVKEHRKRGWPLDNIVQDWNYWPQDGWGCQCFDPARFPDPKAMVPTCTVANLPVNSGARARCFADYMRIHAYEATGGKTYATMPHYATEDGKGTAVRELFA